jgi:two-component system phosphate regulon response regulator PhoB
MDLVLVVDSDGGSRRSVQECLAEAGYTVRVCSAPNLLTEAVERRPCLILIAAVLPDTSGLELCRRVRLNPKLAKLPIILLLVGAAEQDRVQALEWGADDCITKPFSAQELVARVQAVLRRMTRPVPTSTIEPADIVIDSSAMILSVRGSEVPTTALEFRLLEYLARHRGRVFTRDVLLDEVWGDMRFVTPRSVDACIRRIRDKIEPDRLKPTYLKTVRGVGYRLDAVTAWHSRSTDGCTCAACVAARKRPGTTAAGASERNKMLLPAVD